MLALGCVVTINAQEIQTASAVADKVGQAIVFQDEIKAVSYSRSTEGYYLSFGAPYPKQVLSVWASKDLYDHLPGHHGLVGRTVRIKGNLEKSPTGPLLKLQFPEDFQLFQVDQAMLAKPALDGKQDRGQFEIAVYQTFKGQDFDTLEMLGQELRQSRERLNDGSWLSEAFFASFRLKARASTERYGQVEQLIASWGKSQACLNGIGDD